MARSQKAPKMDQHLPDVVEERLTAHVQSNWPNCRGIKVRRHGQFVYVDAQPADADEAESFIRLRYLGDVEDWEMAFFTWSREAYEPSVLNSGSWSGSPEECFDTAAATMLA